MGAEATESFSESTAERGSSPEGADAGTEGGAERITKRRSRITWNYFCTEPDGGFLGFGFPVRPSKSLRGGDVPFCSFRILAGRFEVASQLERDHGVAGFFEQIGKLPNGIFTGASPTNAGRDLFPVSHVLACIVAVEA